MIMNVYCTPLQFVNKLSSRIVYDEFVYILITDVHVLLPPVQERCRNYAYKLIKL